MTLLAVLPCRDKDDFGDMTKSYTTISSSHSENEKAGKETCTPFCTCSCCSTVRTISIYQPLTDLYLPEVKKTFGEPNVPALPEQSISISQPPQIS
jgi:hypothetical protein